MSKKICQYSITADNKSSTRILDIKCQLWTLSLLTYVAYLEIKILKEQRLKIVKLYMSQHLLQHKGPV